MKDYTKSKKYQAVLSTAQKLFWKHGFKRVSIEEICKEAEVSKMTFYKFFPNKIELAKIILYNIIKEATRQFLDIITSSCAFEEKIEQMIVMKMEGLKDISADFLNDIYKNPENTLLEYLTEYRQESMDMFVNFMEEAKKDGLVRADIKIDFIIYQIDLLTQTVRDEKMLKLYQSTSDLVRESMQYLFYGLMPIKK